MEPSATAPLRTLPRTFEALAYKDFRYLWLGQIANSASIWTEQVARPLLIIHMIPDPAQAALHVGLVLAARTVPQFGLGLVGGVFADWYDRRTLLLISKTSSTLVQIVLAALLLMGVLELWHVYATTILRGMATSFDQPARHSLIPSLVPTGMLTNAVALNSAGMQVMRIGGAPLAALLVVATGFAGAFVAVAIFGAVAVLFTVLLRVPAMETIGSRGARAAVTSLRDGLRYAWGEGSIRGSLLLMMAYFGLGMSYLQVFAPLLALHVMDIGDAGYALMVSTAGIGALAGLLVIATIQRLPYRGPVMLGIMAALGVLFSAFGLSTYLDTTVVTFAIVGIVGTLQSIMFATANTVLLEAAQPRMRGRIMGLLSLDRSMITAGGVGAGLLSAMIGPQLAQVAFGVMCLIFAGLLATLLPDLRRFR